MATRNPLNQRYQGEGPEGQTRKSASSAKPATQAASSVHIKKKPTTAAEKRAAAKAREREAAKKAKEKAAKQAEKAKLASAEAEKLNAVSAKEDEPKQEAPAKKSWGPFNFLKTPENEQKKAPVASYKTPEYLKWRKIYWILLAIGITALFISFFSTNYIEYGSPPYIILLVIVYAAIFGSFYVNYRKMRPLEKKSMAAAAKKTPKALKHEQEAREQAAQVEAARKAAKARKKNKQEQERVLASDEEEELEK